MLDKLIYMKRNIVFLLLMLVFTSCERQDIFSNGTLPLGLAGLMAGGSSSSGGSTIVNTYHYIVIGNNGNAWNSQDVNGALGSWMTGAAGGTNLRDIIYRNGQFVTVGGDLGSNNGVILYSPTSSMSFASGTGFGAIGGLNAITYGNGLFMTVGYGGSGAEVWRSADGQAWNSGTPPPFMDLRGVAFGFISGYNAFVVSGHSVGTTTYSIDNGNSWSPGYAMGGQLNDVAYGNGVFIAVGNAGSYHIVTGILPPAMPIVTASSYGSNNLNSIAFGNGHFVAVGASGTILWSNTNGASWNSVGPGGPIAFSSVTYCGGTKFVAGATSNQYFESFDSGHSWTQMVPSPSGSWPINGIGFAP